MIKAVLFDMDGLLIDSEPLWNTAKLEAAKKVGIELNQELLAKTMGLKSREIVDFWYRQAPWDGYGPDQLEHDIISRVKELIKKKGKPMKGHIQALEFAKSKGVKVALASSSRMEMIQLVLKQLDIRDYFDVIHSAEFEDHGKPHPAIYLTTAEKLGISPLDCLVLEDSLGGTIAAKAARMKCILIPDKFLRKSGKASIADKVLDNLYGFDEDVWEEMKA